MNTLITGIEEYIEDNKSLFKEELIEFLSIPSISADSVYHQFVGEAAEFVKGNLLDSGVENVKVYQTEGLPLVYGEKFVDPEMKTILIYGHFDVQPADPLGEWETAPFSPSIKDGKIYARGACDDKAQMMIPIKAVQYLIKSEELGFNLKFLFEGEEEVGSVSLNTFICQNKELLKADVSLIVDTFLHDSDTPAIIYGVKGAILVDIEVQGASEDAHSGLYGGVVKNTAEELTRLIASLKDAEGSVLIDKFYDNVQAPSQEEVLNMQEISIRDGVDIKSLEIQAMMPTLEVNGIISGYTGEGVKTIIPSKASAKISIRTVPGQSSETIIEDLKKHLNEVCRTNDFSLEIKASIGCSSAVMDLDHWIFKKAGEACNQEFLNPIVYERMGGSIPVVGFLNVELGVPSLLLGFGLESDNIHAPNEHYHLSNYYRGIKTITHLLKKSI
ncbi:MAG: dipeptidase [Crocinitomicaceae bacterium]|nr:dipeptidase [Crocinitomicaceae bacterium]